MTSFRLASAFVPTGDQPKAIEALAAGLTAGDSHQVLLGVTGSGKTFTLAGVIEKVARPALIIAPNKTLAAQLYEEFRNFFPDNAVEYFVSYYDYYQPEAYVPSSDLYIEKEATINDDIDRLRHSATRSLLERNDVIIVATVSCIYGLGSAEAYYDMLLSLERGARVPREQVLSKLIEIRYERNDIDFHRGAFRVRGDVLEIFPAHAESEAVRVEWFDDEVESISEIDPLLGQRKRMLDKLTVYPNSHYVTDAPNLERAIKRIREELEKRLAELTAKRRLLEAQRLEQRTRFDLEMLEQTGHCQGIENYSRHLTGRAPGEPPPCLLDFFPKDFFVVLDESHVTLPQLAGMYRGDRARKETLVEHGFRLPSALDNRPLNSEEFAARVSQVIYTSATPGDLELDRTGGVVVEQIVRPTGLLDPRVTVQPVAGQVDSLLEEIRRVVAAGRRVLVTTLTKRMAEDLTEHYMDLGVKVRYLHSDIDTIERVRLLRDLRLGEFDVLIGINLLREGLDLPEVELVAILDADKEGFLRSARSLVQTCGRAARNLDGRVIMYADRVTAAMRHAIGETERRRAIQRRYNEEHEIVPATVVRSVGEVAGVFDDHGAREVASGMEPRLDEPLERFASPEEMAVHLARLEEQMKAAANELQFERAAGLRDRIRELRRAELALR